MVNSSDNSSTEDDHSIEYHDSAAATVAASISRFIILYVEAIVVFGGLIGNALIVNVFRKSNYYNKSIHVYIRTMSLMNFLVIGGPLMMHWLNYNFFPQRKNLRLCVLLITVGRVCFDSSAWLIVAMASNQYIAVLFPHDFKTSCSTRRCWATVAIVVGCSLAKNSYVPWVAGFVQLRVGTKICCIVPDYESIITVSYQWFDLCMSSVFPYLAMTYFNGRVYWRLRAKKTYGRKVRQLTTMLLIVSHLFIVSSLSKKIADVVLTYKPDDPMFDADILILVIASAPTISYAAGASNIWVYLAVCKEFRNDVLALVCPCLKKQKVDVIVASGHQTGRVPVTTGRQSPSATKVAPKLQELQV